MIGYAFMDSVSILIYLRYQQTQSIILCSWTVAIIIIKNPDHQISITPLHLMSRVAMLHKKYWFQARLLGPQTCSELPEVHFIIHKIRYIKRNIEQTQAQLPSQISNGYKWNKRINIADVVLPFQTTEHKRVYACGFIWSISMNRQFQMLQQEYSQISINEITNNNIHNFC